METTLAIVGPTATGKTELAIEIAEQIGGEIINADALQVYRGFDIGTAKPSKQEQQRVPHHLIDIVEAEHRYSAGEFSKRGRKAIEEIRGRGKQPIVVGGSGLYIRSLFEGLSPVPPGDPEVHSRLRKKLEEEGLEALRKQLKELDPVSALRISSGDTQRILRALEVALVTGRPLGEWIADQPFGEQALPSTKICLTLPKSLLYDRIECRVQRMVDYGWVEEVRNLLASGVNPEAPAFQAIGYRQIVRFLNDETTLEVALGDTVQATKRFAKRQNTWFRKEPGVQWVDALGVKGLGPDLMSMSFLNGFGGSNGEAQH
ncbi:MAG: tRNA (adenosine(37)-N6)-dimethylallyltransferase MiaA [Deltaproteobacteria bacterium]|nr:tRNA (adenosine(37)-N6)-dimethylallyltransferase MiaA [Deltaproteobacteria bacterium]